jgi:hypothetical protein
MDIFVHNVVNYRKTVVVASSSQDSESVYELPPEDSGEVVVDA